MELGLKGKVAIVTGAGRGIGEQIALSLSGEGVAVVIDDTNRDAGQNVKEKIEQQGGQAMAFDADITNSMEIEDMVGKVKEKFGRIDLLVNNACAPIKRTPFLELDLDEWRQVFEVNVNGTFICSKAVADVMVRQGHGKIINISSFAAKLPAAGQAAYSASKAAIELLSKTMAGELGRYGIRVMFIRPGVIETEITKPWHQGEVGENMLKPIPLKRFGEPIDVGNLIVFLASQAADYINGGPIPIDGGKYIVQ
jgi:NAD(P)-dependent dehydrogenase (short-subunit alcohol dehydrogenase family)